jgi:hypothetical protein
MPNQQILNFMNQGAPPSLTQNMEARDLQLAGKAADVGGSLADMEMNQMKMDAMKQKQSLLQNFQGPELNKRMMAQDPELAMKMEKHMADMDEGQRKQMEDRFAKLSTFALADDTPDKWKARKWKQPFDQREQIMSMGTKFTEMLSYQRPPAGSKGGGGAGGLKAADENAMWKYTQGLFKGIYSPTTGQFMGFKKDTSREEAMKVSADASRLLADNPNMTRLEAVQQSAKKNGIGLEKKENANPMKLERRPK